MVELPVELQEDTIRSLEDSFEFISRSRKVIDVLTEVLSSPDCTVDTLKQCRATMAMLQGVTNDVRF